MGKLNVSMLRYLSPEDFRVLTAVLLFIQNRSIMEHLVQKCFCLNQDRNGYEES
jgi:hypothetical protein